MKIPRAPVLIAKNPSALRAWNDLWVLLADNDMDQAIYAPTVMAMAMEMGLAEDASEAVYRPLNTATGERKEQTLEQYLAGRNSQTAQELTLLRDSLKQIARLAAEFGASPLAQKKVGNVQRQPDESPMMQYIRAANERMAKKKVS